VLFYALLLLVAVPVTRFAYLGMERLFQVDESSSGLPWRAVIALFDGLFVFHYVIESRIWKFNDPYYRRSLMPLYFRPRRPAGAGVTSETSSPEPDPISSRQVDFGPLVEAV
jgi:hypothetical protein